MSLAYAASAKLAHNHDPKCCDLIVCWEDNWGTAAPVKVLALKTAIRKLGGWQR